MFSQSSFPMSARLCMVELRLAPHTGRVHLFRPCFGLAIVKVLKRPNTSLQTRSVVAANGLAGDAGFAGPPAWTGLDLHIQLASSKLSLAALPGLCFDPACQQEMDRHGREAACARLATLLARAVLAPVPWRCLCLICDSYAWAVPSLAFPAAVRFSCRRGIPAGAGPSCWPFPSLWSCWPLLWLTCYARSRKTASSQGSFSRTPKQARRSRAHPWPRCAASPASSWVLQCEPWNAPEVGRGPSFADGQTTAECRSGRRLVRQFAWCPEQKKARRSMYSWVIPSCVKQVGGLALVALARRTASSGFFLARRTASSGVPPPASPHVSGSSRPRLPGQLGG